MTTGTPSDQDLLLLRSAEISKQTAKKQLTKAKHLLTLIETQELIFREALGMPASGFSREQAARIRRLESTAKLIDGAFE